MHRSKLAKLLGLSIVAITVMAMNASAAQANWQLLRNGSAVKTLNLNLQLLLTELLLGYLEKHFHCPSGTGSLSFLVTSPTTLMGSGTTSLEGCKVKEHEATCTVRSPGAPAGELITSFEGEAEMSGTETFMDMESSNFLTFLYEGALCPFNELEGETNGSMKLSLPGAETEVTERTGSLNDITLFFGEEPVSIHGASFHATEVNGGKWAVRLTGL
jgi:hypothetical protein